MKLNTVDAISMGICAGLIILGLIAYYLPSLNAGNNGITTYTTLPASLPAYAQKTNEIKEAYLFAQNNSALIDGINCYCGCMKVAPVDEIHDRGLFDCFLEDNGSFDEHGSNCTTCVNEILRVKQLLGEGKTKEEMKTVIDSEYGHPAQGSGCNIMPNTTSNTSVFVIPQTNGGGCAIPTTTSP